MRPSRGGGEVGFSLKIPRGGGRSRGAGRMSGEFLGGGGAKYFFFGAETSTKLNSVLTNGGFYEFMVFGDGPYLF